MVDKTQNIRFNIAGQEITIENNGTFSPNTLDLDDTIYVGGLEANLFQRVKVISSLSNLTTVMAAGLQFKHLKTYLGTLQTVHDSQYPASKLEPAPINYRDLYTSYLGSIKRLGIRINHSDYNITIPEIIALHIEGRIDTDILTKKLSKLSPEKRTAIYQALTDNFVFRPVRTYQANETKRFAEMVVAYFTRWLGERDENTESTAFPTTEWAQGMITGRMLRKENAQGLKYIKRLVSYAKKMGTSHLSQASFFSQPHHLALLLRSLVAPKETYFKDEYRYYYETEDFANIVAERTYSFGTVVFYSIDNIFPTEEVVNSIAEELEQTEYETDYNPVLHVIFTPDVHGARISMAEQFYKGDPIPHLFGFVGDYVFVGLNSHRIPTCTINHEVGHQLYWQLAETFEGTVGELERAFIGTLHKLYIRAMKTDGAEMFSDSTFTGLLRSGHPYKFIEFFPAIRHAFVEHADELLKRIQETPKGHYSRDVWKFFRDEIYGFVFTSDGSDLD